MEKKLKYKTLFSPIIIANQEIKNRIVLAPVGIGLESQYYNGKISTQFIDYFEARAKGGAGLIISCFAAVDKRFYSLTLGAFERDQLPGISRAAEAVKVFGAKFILQISHFGGKAPRNFVLNDPIAPSSITSRMYPEVPGEMTIQDIEEIIDLYIKSGIWAWEAGCDGVELHAAHGYLLGQFISPHSNRRNDEYGGSFEKRMHVVGKISKAIREQCGDDFIIGLKFSAHEHLKGGINTELAKAIASFLDRQGILDYLHVSAFSTTLPGLLECDYPSVPPVYIKPPLVPLAAEVKSSVDRLIVIATGGITDPDYAESVLSEGKADLIALGRALIADPEWPNKAKKDRPILYCVKCNLCYKRVLSQQSIKCSVNPYIGEERRYEQYKKGKAGVPLKVCVVGSGPGGMEAAITADKRGHSVVLLEKDKEIGGYLRLAGIPQFKMEYRKLLESYRSMLKESEVEVRVAVEAQPEYIVTENPDAVILALGSKPLVPDIPGISSEEVLRAVDLLEREQYDKLGPAVVIIGAGLLGCELALHICDKLPSVKIRIVDLLKADEILVDEPLTNRSMLLWKLKNAGVELISGHEIVEINEKGITAVNNKGDREFLQADTIVLSTGFMPQMELCRTFKERIHAMNPEIELYEIGDCVKCERIYNAINSGAHAAWRLGP
jgi:2,4-dienoyl-CoA reductase-like NADH-dependent reductase (Old Yellow Enzyme family)/thioredoxin reductase